MLDTMASKSLFNPSIVPSQIPVFIAFLEYLPSFMDGKWSDVRLPIPLDSSRMEEISQSRKRVFFGPFEVDFEAREIRKRGIRMGLQGQPFQILEMLLERPGEIVTRDQVRTRLWCGDTFGDFDHGINKAINKLREALNDSATNSRYVETVARRGYRFIAEVKVDADTPSPAESAPQTATTAPATGLPESNPNTVNATSKHSRIPRLWLGISALLVVSLAGVFVFVVRREVPAQKIRSLAVLPLENLSGDASQEYFADGMTDEMITDLGTISGLRVISRTSVMAYKHVRKPLPVVARELGVDAVLEGAVLRVGSRVRITAQLVRADTDEHLWSHSYEGDLRDTLQLQEMVARTVADTVRVKITSEEQILLNKTRLVNPEAHDAYLKGRYFWNKRTGPALTKAVESFNQAIQIDPRYAEAYSGLADSYALLGDWEFGSVPPAQAFPKAKSAAEKAIQLDDNLGAAHASLALCLKIFDWNWKGSEAELVRAIQLNPSYASAHQWYGWLLVVRGRINDGIKEMKTAAALDPLSLIIGADLADAFLIAHRYDESVRQSQLVIEMDPRFSMAHYQLGQAYAQMREYDKSIRELQEAISLSGRNPIFLSHLGYVYAISGKTKEALQMVEELEKTSRGPYFNPADIALIYVGLDRKDEAFGWLDRAYQIRFNPSALTRPAYDTLRSDPRYSRFLRRIGLIQ